MEFLELVQSFVTDFLNENSAQVRFISLPASKMDSFPSLIKENKTVIDLKDNWKPIKPFMEILSHEKISRDRLEQVVYHPQQRTFESFIKNGKANERNDMIIAEEIFYEKKRIKDSIVELLTNDCKGLYIVLNAQKMCEESITILKILENYKLSGKIIFCFDSVKVETEGKLMSEFYEEISNHKNFFDFSTAKDTESTDYSVSEFEEFQYTDVINTLRDNRLFLSWEQGIKLATYYSQNINNFDIDNFERRGLLMEIGLNYFYAEHYDDAALYFISVLEFQFDDETNIHAMYYLSWSLLMKNSNSEALKYAKLIQVKLNENHDSVDYARAVMVDYLITERADTLDSLVKYKDVLDLLQQHNLINSYAYTILVIPWSIVNDKEYIDIILKNVENGYQLALQYDNQFGLSIACHWKGILYSNKGEKEEATKWFNECNRIRTEIGDLSPIIKIRNGLSWEALLQSDYVESYNYINSFISRIDEIDDYPEIIITLKNIAYSLFFSRHYDDTYVILQKILHFMHIFGLEDTNYNSFLPEYNDIIVLKGIIDIDRGDIIRAKINYHNVLNNGRGITKLERSLLFLLKANISLYDKNLEEAEESFSEAISIFNKNGINQEHRICYMYYEFAITLMRMNYTEKSQKYFLKGLEYSKKKNLKYYNLNKDSITLEEYLLSIQPVEKLNINLGYIEEKAEKDRLMNQIHVRLHDYQFLNKIMAFGSDSIGIKVYAKNIVQSLFDYLMADAVFIAEKIENEWKIISNINRSYDSIPSYEVWEKLSDKYQKKDLCKIVYEPKYKYFFVNLSKYEFKGAIIIVPGKSSNLNPEMLNTVNISLSNVQAQLVMIKQNEHLLYISSTDQLSSLKNRRALQEHIITENEKLMRMQTKRNFIIQETVAFVDLDNFKYYNDTYGHEVGDILISCFARLLKKIYRKVDFISRFGGDEFVIILTDATCHEGKRVAQRIYDALKAEEYFIPEIEKHLERKIEVPENRKIGFSMGLCSNLDLENRFDLEQAMIKADQALYYSKEHGKGCVTIWSEIAQSLLNNPDSDNSLLEN